MSVSVFEIVGPIMIGPSSSHTAGMARIGMMTHRIVGENPVDIHLDLSPKMRTTYSGHRTDAALFGGVIGLTESDPDIRRAIDLAHERGVKTSVGFLESGKYPENTALLTVKCENGETVKVLGTSVGGGSIAISEVDGVKMNVNADAWHLVIWSSSEIPSDMWEGSVSVQVGKNEREYISCISFADQPDTELTEKIAGLLQVRRMKIVAPVLPYGMTRISEKLCSSCEEVCKKAAEKACSLTEIAIEYEMKRSGHTREQIREQMKKHLEQIKKSVVEGEKGNQMLYGLTSGHDGPRMLKAIEDGKTVSGGIVPKAVARALGVMEYNGAMGCIVAAPTAGSSGIVPGSVVTVQQEYGFSDEKIEDALFVASLMGVVMENRDVSFSGSVGGCQGEVGVSSAITAAAIASLFTDDPEAITHAMAICLKNLLGLVCDPIAGPIEVPCIKRNAVGVANAFTSADMALAGIRSYIPPDEVIDALVDVEKRLPSELRCATTGGLACTATACRLREKLEKKSNKK